MNRSLNCKLRSAALFSSLEGEMAAQQPEGVTSEGTATGAAGAAAATPPVAFGDTLPSRGRETSAIAIDAELPRDVAARERLLDRAMGPGRRRKSSEKLRRGRLPAEGLAFVARDDAGHVVGTVRLWDVAFERDGGSLDGAALLLGPLAVDPALKGAGVGSALMRHAISEAARLGNRAILLVGDAPYYARFGFSANKTGSLAMPGPYERQRFLALEIVDAALDGAKGVLRVAGRKAESAELNAGNASPRAA